MIWRMCFCDRKGVREEGKGKGERGKGIGDWKREGKAKGVLLPRSLIIIIIIIIAFITSTITIIIIAVLCLFDF